MQKANTNATTTMATKSGSDTAGESLDSSSVEDMSRRPKKATATYGVDVLLSTAASRTTVTHKRIRRHST